MKILFLTHRLPYAPNRGDRVRAFHLLREMSRWASVDLVSLVHDDGEASHVGHLRDLAATITIGRPSRLRNQLLAAVRWPTAIPTTHTMLRCPELAGSVKALIAKGAPDVVVCYCTGIAPIAMLPELSTVPVLLDMVDVDSQKWAAMSTSASPPMSWVYSREARTLSRCESRLAGQAFCTTVVTEREKASLEQIVPGARIEVVPNGVDAAALKRPEQTRQPLNVVFCGVMDYRPNVEAVRWFVRTVWPEVRRQAPDASFSIVGSSPDETVKALAAEPGVEVVGAVADVRPYLWRATLSVAPLLTARGVQNKVLEAIAAGLPAVITPVVAAGIPDEALPACIVADGAPAFTAAVVRELASTQESRDDRVRRANMAALSWTHRLARFQTLLSEAARR